MSNLYTADKPEKFLANKRAQSALEYMMTYGWAILIIVIVAVILYSMGIFNPSSSITSSLAGFSGLGSASAEVIPNSGIVLILGDNVGYDINITNITVSFDGKTATILPNNLVSVESLSKFFIPFSSITTSSSYSFAVIVHYTEPGQILKADYTSKGTIYGTSPGSAGAYIPITITNSQTKSTPAPFQEWINFSESEGGWYTVTNPIASNYQNVEFFTSQGSAMSSWLENYSSTEFMYWLKLQNGIPASSSVTIYMVYFPKSYNVLNNFNDGEAPQIPCIEEGITNTSKCSVYGEYDNGNNVFNNYWNFAGTSIPAGWTIAGSAVFNNKLELTSNDQNPGIYSSTLLTAPIVIDALINPTSSNTYAGGYDASVAFTAGYGSGNGMGAYWGIGSTLNGQVNGWLATSNTDPSVANTYYLITGYYISGAETLFENYNNIVSATNTFSNSYLALAAYSSTSSTSYVQWVRVRAYPPNGIMPSRAFGVMS